MGEHDLDKMNHPAMDDMKKSFDEAAKTLDGTMQALKQQSQQMANGALLGDGGDAFAQLLQGPATKKVTGLKETMERLSKAIQKAQAENRKTEKAAKGDVQR